MRSWRLPEIETPDGTAEAYLARPESEPKGGVLVYMDAIGLRPQLAEMIERVASWGYVALAPNAFYRDGSAAELAPTADLRDPAARDAYFADGAMARVRGLSVARLVGDISAYVQCASDPSCSTIHSARWSPRSAATASKWSSAQLNSPISGHRKARRAVS